MSKPTERRSYSSLKSRKPLKQSQLKGQLIPISKNSPYRQNHSIAKIRSSSMSRGKPHSRNLMRCASNANFYMKQKQSSKGTNSYSQLPSSSSMMQSASTESSRMLKRQSSDRLESRIKSLLKNPPLNPLYRFNRVQSALQELISQRPESTDLSLIKNAYQEIFDRIQQQEIQVLTDQNNQLVKNIEQFKADSKVMHRKIDKLSRENHDLNKSINQKDAEFAEMQERIAQINSVDVEPIPKNIDTWKYIVTENKSYYDMCSSLRTQIKEQQLRVKQLLQLISTYKSKGVPVEDIFYAEVQNKTEDYQSDTDNEMIVTGSARNASKPDSIPNLDFTKIECESSSSSSSLTSK